MIILYCKYAIEFIVRFEYSWCEYELNGIDRYEMPKIKYFHKIFNYHSIILSLCELFNLCISFLFVIIASKEIEYLPRLMCWLEIIRNFSNTYYYTINES